MRCLQPPQDRAAVFARQHAARIPEIRTERLVLRAPKLSDFDTWSALFDGPESSFLGGPLSQEEAWEAYCVYVAGWTLHGHGLWSVERQSDPALVGFVLLGLEWGDAEPELGWLIAPKYRRQGFATEAGRAAQSFALSLFGPGQIVSCIDPDNVPSRRLAQRLGAWLDASCDPEVFRHGNPTR